MEYYKLIVYIVLVAVIVTTIISGPLFGAVNLTNRNSEMPKDGTSNFSPGTGNIEVTVVAAPDTAALDKTDFGSGAYVLEIPPATVDVQSTSGQPMLIYKVKIPNMTYTTQTNVFYSENEEGIDKVVIDSQSFKPENVPQDEYRGRIVILTRTKRGDEILLKKNITIQVMK